MKINFVLTTIALAISGLIAYGLYSFHESENKILLTVGSFVLLATTFTATIGTSFTNSRTGTNIKTVSSIFFIGALISSLIFTFITFSVPVYIITNGIILLIYLLIVYSINKANQ
jgi:hypothetical protein